MSVAEKLMTIAENEPKVYDAGKQAERIAFWNANQTNGTRVNYRYGYYGLGFTNENFNPIYDFHPTIAVAMFQGIRVTKFYRIFSGENARVLDLSNCTDCTNMFNGAYVDRVPYLDLRKCTKTETMFANGVTFGTIDGLEFGEKTTFKNTFLDATGIKHMIVSGVIANNGFNVQYCPLDHESLLSIMNTLQDKSSDTSGTTWTVKIGNTNKAKLTEDEIYIAEQKGWDVT